MAGLHPPVPGSAFLECTLEFIICNKLDTNSTHKYTAYGILPTMLTCSVTILQLALLPGPPFCGWTIMVSLELWQNEKVGPKSLKPNHYFLLQLNQRTASRTVPLKF